MLAKGRHCLTLHMRTMVFRRRLLLGKRLGLLFGRSALAHAHNREAVGGILGKEAGSF